jgi:hypothetical protein
MINAISLVAIGVMPVIIIGCANAKLGGMTTESAAAERDYQLLSGTWQLTRAVVNGKPVPKSVL